MQSGFIVSINNHLEQKGFFEEDLLLLLFDITTGVQVLLVLLASQMLLELDFRVHTVVARVAIVFTGWSLEGSQVI